MIMMNLKKAFAFLGIASMASLIICCKGEKNTGPEPAARILTANPSVLEAGSMASVSILGENTGFGDSVWLEKSGKRIGGIEIGSGTDTTFIAAFEIPQNAELGSYDLVIQGKEASSETRLAKGVVIVASIARIREVVPSKLTAYGLHKVRIVLVGGGSMGGFPRVRFYRGTDTLPIESISTAEDSAITLDAIVAGTAKTGKWDLEVRTASRRMSVSEALEIDPPAASLVSLTPDSAEQDIDIAVTLTGIHTLFNQGTRTVWMERGGGSIPANAANPFNQSMATAPRSETEMEAYFRIPADAEPGAWKIKVRQPWYDLDLEKDFTITLPAVPSVRSISPISASPGERIEAIITGHRVEFAQGTASQVLIHLVKGGDTLFSGHAGLGQISKTEARTFLAPISSDADPGFCDVHASYFVPEGAVAGQVEGKWIALKPLSQAFLITTMPSNSARIASVSPVVLEASSRATLAINGENTRFGDSVWLERYSADGSGPSRIAGRREDVSTDTYMYVHFDLSAEIEKGKWDLAIQQKNGAGTIVKRPAVEIIASTASILRVEPDILESFGKSTLRIACRGIDLNKGPLSLRFAHSRGDTLSITRIDVINDSVAEVDVYSSDQVPRGGWSLTLETKDKTVFRESALINSTPVPELVSVSPSTYERDAYVGVNLTGVHTLFFQGTQTVWMKRGTDSLPTAPDNPIRSSTGTFPKSNTELMAYFHISSQVDTGVWDIHVRQPWYSISRPGAFRIVEPTAPAVKSISPNSGRRGERIELSISGHRTAFLQGTLTHVRVNVVDGADTLFTASGNHRGIYSVDPAIPPYIGTMGIRTSQTEIPANASLGVFDVEVQYFVPTGQSGGQPTGNWIVLPPLLDAFTIRD